VTINVEASVAYTQEYPITVPRGQGPYETAN